MTANFVLVPAEPTAEMEIDGGVAVGNACGSRNAPWDAYTAMLAARPPMQRAVFDAMVERAARAWLKHDAPNSSWEDFTDDYQRLCKTRIAAALRAALPGLTVEGE